MKMSRLAVFVSFVAVLADSVSVSGGKGSYRIENIPVGKNRVVIVQSKSGVGATPASIQCE